jgi:hypothetical protein
MREMEMSITGILCKTQKFNGDIDGDSLNNGVLGNLKHLTAATGMVGKLSQNPNSIEDSQLLNIENIQDLTLGKPRCISLMKKRNIEGTLPHRTTAFWNLGNKSFGDKN